MTGPDPLRQNVSLGSDDDPPFVPDFDRQVRDALAHLNDPPYLRRHPLTAFLGARPGVKAEAPGRALRECLLDAIEAVRPGPETGVAARSERRYEILRRCFVEEIDPPTVRKRLGLSKSQFYRDREQALGAISLALAERWGADRLPGRRRGTVAPDEPAIAGPMPGGARLILNNLPTPLTTFVGREREIQEARQLLATSRLLTLTGPAGTGKTRLGLEIARAAIDGFANGACFVSLAPIRDPALVAPTIARALGVTETPNRPAAGALKEWLRDKELLLVLDNFEQVIRSAPLLVELLTASSQLTILVTSRAALRVSGEQQFPVAPLTLPDRRALAVGDLLRFSAVELFVQRGRAVDPAFTIDDATGPTIATICRRLDGLPLAIELATAHVRLLPVADLLGQLDECLALPAGGARDLPPRQQTLRGAISWSHDLLDGPEKTLFRRLTMFRGSFCLESARDLSVRLGSWSLAPFASLVNRSLLLRDASEAGEPRYRMLETIREFGARVLTASGEEGEARRAHLEHFRALAERAEGELTGRQQLAWLNRLERERDNFRAALEWAIETGQTEAGLGLAGALWRFWWVRAYLTEGRAWLTRILALPGTLEFPAAKVRVLNGAAQIATMQHDYAVARALSQEALGLLRDLGDRPGLANALYYLGVAMFYQGDPGCVATFEEALATFCELNDRRNIANCLFRLGNMSHFREEYAAARPWYEEALAIRREIGDTHGIGYSLCTLGTLLTDLGEYAAAGAAYAESASILRELGDRWELSLLLDGCAGLAVKQRQFERAVLLGEAAAALRETIGADLPPAARSLPERWRAPARRAIDEETFARIARRARALSLDDALRIALDENDR